jgi:hypothetical protein
VDGNNALDYDEFRTMAHRSRVAQSWSQQRLDIMFSEAMSLSASAGEAAAGIAEDGFVLALQSRCSRVESRMSASLTPGRGGAQVRTDSRTCGKTCTRPCWPQHRRHPRPCLAGGSLAWMHEPSSLLTCRFTRTHPCTHGSRRRSTRPAGPLLSLSVAPDSCFMQHEATCTGIRRGERHAL